MVEGTTNKDTNLSPPFTVFFTDSVSPAAVAFDMAGKIKVEIVVPNTPNGNR